MNAEDPYQVLGLPPGATDDQIRAAYLRGIKEYPPDRAPAEFERLRDAYEVLRDPRRRARELLFCGERLPRLDTLVEGRRARRRFVGPKPWLAVLKEK